MPIIHKIKRLVGSSRSLVPLVWQVSEKELCVWPPHLDHHLPGSFSHYVQRERESTNIDKAPSTPSFLTPAIPRLLSLTRPPTPDTLPAFRTLSLYAPLRTYVPPCHLPRLKTSPTEIPDATLDSKKSMQSPGARLRPEPYRNPTIAPLATHSTGGYTMLLYPCQFLQPISLPIMRCTSAMTVAALRISWSSSAKRGSSRWISSRTRCLISW